MEGIFTYREGRGFLYTRIHPLTKMVAFLSVMFLAGIWLDVRFLLPLFFTGVVLAVIAGVPSRVYMFIVIALALTWYPTLRATVAQANPEYFKVLDPDWAATSVLTINIRFLALGRLGLTYGSLYWLAGRIVRFASVVIWGVVLLYTTPISEIANTLYALNVPNSIVFVIQITYKFIPFMSKIISQIQSAQRLRGWNLRTINIVKLFKRSLPMANPLMRRTAVIVDQVTIATQIRGFGSGKVTPLRDLTLSGLDKVLIVFFILLPILAILGMVFFLFGLI